MAATDAHHTKPGWSATSAPLPADAAANPGGELEAVACAAATSCAAVGEYLDTQGGYQGLVETRAGGTWTVTKAPSLANAATKSSTTLAGVSCPSAGSCVARGEYQDTHHNTLGLLVVQHGRTWKSVEAPLPANAATTGQEVDLNAISCPRATHCVAAGDYVGTDGATYGLLEMQSGHGWKAKEAPLPAHAAGDVLTSLDGLSCPSTRWCLATGSYLDAKDNSHGLLAVLSGGTWRTKEAPLPADSNAESNPELKSAQCATIGSCLVTGDYLNTKGRIVPLVDALSHGVWRSTTAPLPANAGNANPGASLTRGSCPTARWCAASGNYGISSVQNAGLLEVYSHGKWNETEAPLPATVTKPTANIRAISCAAVGICMAVGDYEPGGKEHLSQGLIEARSGGTWRPTRAPLPADADASPGAIVDSVACPTTKFCAAVGLYYVTSVKSEGLLETWAR